MKRQKSYLTQIEDFVNFSYSRFRNQLNISEYKTRDLNSPLAYCYKYSGPASTVYKIVQYLIDIPETDYRIKLHEYGHIYLTHLDGIHEDLDGRILDTVQSMRGELIEMINRECGIDYADKLLDRVIDDPSLNHSLHNIAMDMEVNSKILSPEDIEEMEKDITSKTPNPAEEILKRKAEIEQDPTLKEQIEKAIEKIKAQAAVKLILPERYHFKDGSPFPNELTYSEYLLLIVKNLDQFVKMMVSIKNGGNGDTSDVTSEDVQDAIGGDGGDGDGDGGMQSLDDLMDDLGMSSDKEAINSPNQGIRPDVDPNDPTKGQGGDHGTQSRDDADKKRELGQIRSKSEVGCGSSGGPDSTRSVNREVDAVDMAMEDVLMNFKSRVVKRSYKKDTVYNYNRGINRQMIAPTFIHKIKTTTDPTIVFLIDVSGSMDSHLVDRVLFTISKKMRSIGRGLKYNIITWSTRLGEHLKDIDPKKPVPKISIGGGTSMAKGIEYFRDSYSEDAILILISDFDDYLEEWHKVEETMPGYTMYGFNYGRDKYTQKFTYFKVKNFINGYK